MMLLGDVFFVEYFLSSLIGPLFSTYPCLLLIAGSNQSAHLIK